MKTKTLFFIVFLFLISFYAKSQWTEQYFDNSKWFNTIYFTDPDTGYAGNWNGEIYKTIDGGTTWLFQHSEFSGFKGLSFWTPDSGIAVGFNGYILTTTDGGLTWNTNTSATTANLYDIDCPSNDTCFISGDSIVKKSVDGGLTWQTVYSSSTFSCVGIDFVNTQIGYVAGNNGIKKTINGGNTWSLVNDTSCNGISCFDESICYTLSQKDSLLCVRKTIDGGTNWTTVYSNYFSGYTIFEDIQTLTPNVVMVACSTMFALTVLKTIDGGNTWYMQIQNSDSVGLTAIYMLNENEGWVCGLHGIYHTINGGEYVSNNVNSSLYNNVVEIFPNPTNGKINIKAENIKLVEISNELGETIINYNGVNEINLKSFSKGVYFIKVQTDKVVQVKKIILE